MYLKRARRNRPLRWLALAAISLLVCMPVVSQIRAAFVPHAHHHGLAHSGHQEQAGSAIDPADDECWKKCGYCDFLIHTPAIAAVAYLPAFIGVTSPSPVAHSLLDSRFDEDIRVAQPRGPPEILA